MKKFMKMIFMILIYYVFLYCIARGIVMMISMSFESNILIELGCHGFAIIFVILTLTSFDDENNGNNRPNFT
jgi:hypothetical protein